MSPLAQVMRDLHHEVRRASPTPRTATSFAHYDSLDTVSRFLGILAGIAGG